MKFSLTRWISRSQAPFTAVLMLFEELFCASEDSSRNGDASGTDVDNAEIRQKQLIRYCC